MNYTVIDQRTWKRREHFAHYLTEVPCTYSMTVKLDITAIREGGHKLYPAMLYLLTKTVNRHEPFRMALRENDQLVCYDSMEPCYTIFHQASETFSNIWTAYTEDYDLFCRRYEEDKRQYGDAEGFLTKPNLPENSFTVSMMPWTSFESFQVNTPHFRYLIPIFTMGRYWEEGGRWHLPLSMQVHHAVCDGFHACRFLDDLQESVRGL